MALEGIVLNSGSGGQKLATDTVSGFDFQIIKIGIGVDDSTPTSVSDTNPMPVDDAGGSLTVDNAGTFAVQVDGAALTALQLIDNIVSVEDAVHGNGDSGVMALAVRNDALAALAGADGDYAPLQVNASGALFIQEGAALDVSAATVTVDLGANNDVTIDGSSIVKAEDAPHSTGDAGVMGLAVRKATPANLSGADGDYEPLQINAGRLWTSATIDAALPAGTNAIGKLAANSGVDVGDVTINNASGASAVNIQDGGNAITVDNGGTFATQATLQAGTAAFGKLSANSGVDIGDVDVTSVVPGTGANSLGKAEDAAHSTGDAGVMGLAVRKATPADLSDTDGDYEPLQIDNGRLWVSATIDAALPAGTNAIGKLAANSGVDIGDVDVLTQPARVSTTDSIKAVLATDTVMDGTTAEVPIFKAFDVSSSGDNEIVAGVASNKIRVLSLALNAFGDVEAEFQSGGTATNLSGTFDLGTSSGKAKGLVLAFSPIGHFESASGTALDLNLNAAVQVSGHVAYVVVAA